MQALNAPHSASVNTYYNITNPEVWYTFDYPVFPNHQSVLISAR